MSVRPLTDCRRLPPVTARSLYCLIVLLLYTDSYTYGYGLLLLQPQEDIILVRTRPVIPQSNMLQIPGNSLMGCPNLGCPKLGMSQFHGMSQLGMSQPEMFPV
ncbi:hypothetical protein F5050DRAFT_1813732 [Lentinula boryana]|uniref:Uncharacterized protein n=1 Tax=Lentinula boryana TaxID=40481 RepID=A0ABQ8PW31_9AGAR|nr:hypothetical protein F5050DRAFT_1813732 [Lentinula boryana]